MVKLLFLWSSVLVLREGRRTDLTARLMLGEEKSRRA